MKERTARCSCGELSIRAAGDPVKISACHCKACQRRTGSAFSVAVFYDLANAVVTGPSQRYVRPGDSGKAVAFHFCPSCGSTVLWYPEFRPQWVGVAIGCFDDSSLRPTQEVYEQDRRAWVEIDTAAQ